MQCAAFCRFTCSSPHTVIAEHEEQEARHDLKYYVQGILTILLELLEMGPLEMVPVGVLVSFDSRRGRESSVAVAGEGNFRINAVLDAEQVKELKSTHLGSTSGLSLKQQDQLPQPGQFHARHAPWRGRMTQLA